MSKRDWAEDQRICDAATAGPWEQFYGEELRIGTGTCSTVSETVIDDSGVVRYPDATFIAEARTGWPAALDEIAYSQRYISQLELINTQLERELTETIADNQRYRQTLERMDDRKNPMIPRSGMARIAKEALDYGS